LLNEGKLDEAEPILRTLLKENRSKAAFCICRR
jgi:hypothetical protein